MKKVNFIKFIALLAISMSLVFITSCDKDDEATVSIVGLWTVGDATIDMTIDGVSFMDYMVNLGMTQAQAESFWNIMQTEFEMSGTFDIKEGGTIIITFEGEPPENDVWTLSGDNKTLTIGEGVEAMVFDVITLSSTQLVLQWTETESEDMDQDGTNETLVITIKLTLSR